MGTAPPKWFWGRKSEPNTSEMIKLWDWARGITWEKNHSSTEAHYSHYLSPSHGGGSDGAGNLAGDVVLSADLSQSGTVADLENLLVSRLCETWKGAAFLLGDHQAGPAPRFRAPRAKLKVLDG